MTFVDTDAAGSAAETGQQSADEKSLDVQRDVEFMGCEQGFCLFQAVQYRAELPLLEGFVDDAAVPDQQFIDIGIVFQQAVSRRAYEPAEVAVRIDAFEIVGD